MGSLRLEVLLFLWVIGVGLLFTVYSSIHSPLPRGRLRGASFARDGGGGGEATKIAHFIEKSEPDSLCQAHFFLVLRLQNADFIEMRLFFPTVGLLFSEYSLNLQSKSKTTMFHKFKIDHKQ